MSTKTSSTKFSQCDPDDGHAFERGSVANGFQDRAGAYGPDTPVWRCKNCSEVIPRLETLMDVKHVNAFIWEVQSESNPNEWYTVDLSVPHCNCPAWIFGINRQKKKGVHNPTFDCKHVSAAKIAENQSGLDDTARKQIRDKAEEIMARFRKS